MGENMNIKDLFNIFKRKVNKIEEEDNSYVYLISGKITNIDFHVSVNKFKIINENSYTFEIKTSHHTPTKYNKSILNELKIVNKKSDKVEIECACITKDLDKIDDYTLQVEEKLLYLSKTKKYSYLRYNYNFREYKNGYYSIIKPELLCLKNTVKTKYNYFSITKKIQSETWSLNSGYTDGLSKFEQINVFENIMMLKSIDIHNYDKDIKAIVIGVLRDKKNLRFDMDEYVFNLRYVFLYNIKDSEIMNNMVDKYFQIVINNPDINYCA